MHFQLWGEHAEKVGIPISAGNSVAAKKRILDLVYLHLLLLPLLLLRPSNLL